MIKTIVINGLVFFMFGYHVHEKAITPYLHILFVFLTSQKEWNVKDSLNLSDNSSR